MKLTDLLTPETVRAKVAAENREEAIEAAGRLLVDAGAVQQRYVTAMQDVFRELGAYAVIAPGVALPHARPDKGVLRTGMALVTLAHPVPFGHEENDPVDLVIAFAAPDKEAHVAALQELASLLADSTAVEEIRRAGSERSLIQAVMGTPAGSDKRPTVGKEWPKGPSPQEGSSAR